MRQVAHNAQTSSVGGPEDAVVVYRSEITCTPHYYLAALAWQQLEMARFEDLPLELLPLLVANIPGPAHLASLCLVNRTFYAFAVSKLYERIFIYAWQQSPITRVCN
jgi:hypothetical protein